MQNRDEAAETASPQVAGDTAGQTELPIVAEQVADEKLPAAPTLSDIQVKVNGDERARELTPKEIFEKVALNDAKQNARLATKGLNGSSPFRRSKKESSMAFGGGGDPSGSGQEISRTRMRFIVCTLGLMSLAMSQMSRMVLNQSITQMVDQTLLAPEKDTAVSSDGSCPWPSDPKEDLTTPVLFETTTLPFTSPAPFVTTSAPNTERGATTTITSGAIGTTTDSLQPSTTQNSAIAKTVTAIIELESEEDLPSMDEASPDDLGYDMIEPATTREPTTQSDEVRPSPGSPEGTTSEASSVVRDDEETELVATTTVIPDNATHATTMLPADSHDDPSSPYPTYKWTMQQQNTLLGGFYYSYFVFMVLGGRMAEMYGAKYVLLLSVAGSAIINLATPWMASTSFTLLVMSRVVMGAIQAGVFPGMYALIAKWLTMTEASIYAPLIKMNLRLGMVLGSLIPGLASGWPNVFYLTGVLSAVWSLLWLAIASSDPADNKWVSRSELAHINRKKKKAAQDQETPREEVEMGEVSRDQRAGVSASATKTTTSKKATPWLRIITSPSVIGLIIVKLTFNYGLDFLAIELPSYLKYVHHADKETISAITTPMFAMQVVLIVFVGWLAKVAVQRKFFGLDKTGTRKLFQGVASLGMGLTFFLLTLNDCNLTFVIVLLMLTSLLSMFTAGGETMLPYDLSQEYPATIMAIANSIANLSAVTTTTLTGLVLGTQGGSYDRWNILILLIAGANLIGALCFTLLVKAEPIDFDGPSSGGPDLELGCSDSHDKRATPLPPGEKDKQT